jgi:hypothetical protein
VRFGVELHERTVGKQLAALGYRRLTVRPRHPKADPEAQEAFKKTFREAIAAALLGHPGDDLRQAGLPV